ncbi:hypothetical protein [Streptomyces sp. NPDC088719]|uniref:hypothetical protein n=1 Tax=Streptomyces sp. NPDC088719 TaxID=3365872 RepID=UPI0038096243
MTRKRAFAESTAYPVLLGVSGVWGAASSGYPIYTRVFGGAIGVLCVAFLVVEFAERRRNRAAAEVADNEV